VFGTALFGAIFFNRLNHWLARLIPKGTVAGHIKATASGLNLTPRAVHNLPLPVRRALAESVAHAIHTVFWVAVPLAAATIVLAVFLREIRLRDTVGIAGEDLVDATGVPAHADGADALV